MRALRQTLLHGLCGIAGFWFVSSPDQEAPPADAPSSFKEPAKPIAAAGHSVPAPLTSEAGLALLTTENWAEAISPISQMRLYELPMMLRGLLRNPFPDVRRHLLRYLFERWAVLDLTGALAAMRGISSPQHKESALRAILGIWTKSDADAAWQYITAMEDDSVLQEAGIEILLGLNVGAAPLRYLTWAEQLDDVFLREKARVAIGDSWMSKDPQGALAAVMTVEPQRLRDYLLSKLCYRDGVDHTRGLAAVAALPSQAERSRLSEEWIGTFGNHKPQEAFQWLLANADRPELQKSADTLGGIMTVKTKSVADLRAMVLQLPVGPLRDAFAARAADEWANAGRSLAEAESLLSLSGPCLERESARSKITSKRKQH
ncbi:MAG: hypothetical protein RL015_1935 [Verrucomicrobiota bacterium]|jgi:hypothetical protein